MSRICIVCGARGAKQLECTQVFCGANLIDTLPSNYEEEEPKKEPQKQGSVNDIFEDFPPLEY